MLTPAQQRAMSTYQLKKYQLILDAKERPCMDCGIQYPPCVMDLDHRDLDTKAFSIGMGYRAVGYERLREEIAKCDAVCSNCHRVRTWMSD